MRTTHEHSDTPDWDALARFVTGESDPAESAALNRWLDAHPADAEFYRAVGSRFHSAGAEGSVGATGAAKPVDVEAALRKVRSRIEEPRRRARWTAFISVAAAAASIMLLLRPAGRGDAPKGQTSAAIGPTASAMVYSTAPGRRDSVTLADGSRVLLGPDSRLTVAAGYGVNGRAAVLEGIARFDVVHDSAQPFTVREGRAVVEDEGTVFSVSSDADSSVAVSVRQGSVRLRAVQGGTPGAKPAVAASRITSVDPGVVLRAGERGRVDVSGRAAVRTAAAPDDDAWAQGRLVFHDAPMPQVAAELKRWYGLDVTLADSALASRHITATFAGDPAARVLDVVAIAIGARVERRGDSVVLRAQARPATPR